MPLSPPSTDTMPQNANEKAAALSDLDLGGSIEREEKNFLKNWFIFCPRWSLPRIAMLWALSCISKKR
jgi:hypothetical protein